MAIIAVFVKHCWCYDIITAFAIEIEMYQGCISICLISISL